MAQVDFSYPVQEMHGKPWQDADFAYCTSKRTGKVHTQKINPWTHPFNEKQLAAQARTREANKRVSEILHNPILRSPYEDAYRTLPEPDRPRLRDYIYKQIYRQLE